MTPNIHDIPGIGGFYTKKEVDDMIAAALDEARAIDEKSMADRLSSEIIAASKEEGAAFKKKEDTHRMAEANKAFSHFRF